MKLEITIKFDREIVPDKYYISPGSCEMTFNNGITTRFDFMDTVGAICEYDTTQALFECYNLDLESFPESEFLGTFNGSVTKINEVFIYTGDDEDPEINPVEVVEMRLFNDNDEMITFPEKMLPMLLNRLAE